MSGDVDMDATICNSVALRESDALVDQGVLQILVPDGQPNMCKLRAEDEKGQQPHQTLLPCAPPLPPPTLLDMPIKASLNGTMERSFADLARRPSGSTKVETTQARVSRRRSRQHSLEFEEARLEALRLLAGEVSSDEAPPTMSSLKAIRRHSKQSSVSSCDGSEKDAERGPAAEPRPWRVLIRANSTNSMYTVTDLHAAPDYDEVSFSTACYLHDRTVAGEAFLRKRRAAGKPEPPLFFAESRADGAAAVAAEGNIPDEEAMHEHLRTLHERAEFSAECFVVALLYMERLFMKASLPPLRSNWQSLILTALVLAAKVWDDTGSSNAEFSSACELPLRDVNCMEARFLNLIDWNVRVNPSLYIATFMELRAICDNGDDKEQPANPTGVLDAQRQEANSLERARRVAGRARTSLDIRDARLRHM